jgi:hypothetical protein
MDVLQWDRGGVISQRCAELCLTRVTSRMRAIVSLPPHLWRVWLWALVGLHFVQATKRARDEHGIVIREPFSLKPLHEFDNKLPKPSLV